MLAYIASSVVLPFLAMFSLHIPVMYKKVNSGLAKPKAWGKRFGGLDLEP